MDMIALALFIPMLFSFNPEGEAREIVLHISLVDHFAGTDYRYHRMNWMLQNRLPTHALWGVKVDTLRFLNRAGKVRRHLVRRLNALPLGPEDQITHLVIDTHGGSYAQEENTFTSLRSFGKFSEEGPDTQLAEVLAPLRGHFAPNASIILNSCSTMCEGEAAAVVRTQALLQYLGIPNGQLYGSVVAEQSEFYENPYPYVQAWLIGTLATLTALAPQMHGQDPEHFFFTATLLPSLVSGTVYLGRLATTWAQKHSGLGNQGRLIRFREGRLETVDLIDKGRSRKALYDREECALQLGFNAKVYSQY